MQNTLRILTCLITLLLAAAPMMAQTQAPRTEPGSDGETPDTAETSGNKELTVLLLPVVPMGRTGAPSPVVAEFTYNRNGLLRGRLQLSVRENATSPFTVTTQELVLGGGATRLPINLPPIPGSFFNTGVLARGTFITDEGRRIDLGEHVLPIANVQQRSLAVGISNPWSNRRLTDVLESLQLERYRPDRDNRLMQTGLVFVKPANLASQPEHLLTFDMLVLADEGLSYLSTKQLEAIYDWVRVGGRLLVIPGANMKAEHLALLNRLAGAARYVPQPIEAETAVLAIDVADDADEAMPVTIGPRNASAAQHNDLYDRYRVGLGRAVIVHGASADRLPQHIASNRWRDAVSFLWHVREAQRDRIRTTALWSETQVTVEDLARSGAISLPDDRSWDQLSDQEKTEVEQRWDVGYELQMRNAGTGSYGVVPAPVGNTLVQTLMPQSVRFVPMWVIWVALGTLVLLIGPVDYVLLGSIRRRKWTWIIFPLLTIAFTVGMLQISRWYLGETTSRKALVIRDVGEDGVVLRESRFELWFAGGSGMRDAAIDDGFFTPMSHRQFLDNSQWFGWQQVQDVGAADEPVQYVGRVPGEYSVHQMLRRWTPQLNRRTTLLPDVERLDINWEAASPEGLIGRKLSALMQAEGTGSASEIISNQMGKNAAVYTVHRSQSQASTLATVSDGWGYLGSGGLPEALQQITSRRETGLFNVVSAIAPNAAPNFEDLAILDSSDPLQFAVLIVIQEGEDIIVYRRVFHRKANAT